MRVRKREDWMLRRRRRRREDVPWWTRVDGGAWGGGVGVAAGCILKGETWNMGWMRLQVSVLRDELPGEGR